MVENTIDTLVTDALMWTIKPDIALSNGFRFCPPLLCRMKGVAEGQNTTNSLHSVIKEYLAAFSPVSPKLTCSAHILDASQQLLTLVRGVDYQFSR